MTIFSIVPIDVCSDDRLTKMQIKVLIALLSFRNKNTDTCFPKRKALSDRCGYTEQTISKVTKQLVDLGWLQKEGSGGYSSPCRYKITVPELETVSKPETVSEPANKTVSESATITVSKPATRKEQTNKQTNEQTSVSRKRSTKSCLTVFLDNCKKTGEKAISPDDTIFDYCEKAGIQEDWLRACWLEFSADYKSKPEKKYSDWRGHFRNAVRRNWYQLWWTPQSGVCELTSKGRQAMAAYGDRP